MKHLVPPSPWISAMVKMFAVLAAASAQIVVGRSAAQASVVDSSFTQIRDTLRNLQRSIKEAGKADSGISDKRQKWCTATLKSLDDEDEASRISLGRMKAELEEQAAAAEEAAGTAQQVQADIDLVQHTAKQTQDTLQAFKAEASTLQDSDSAEKLRLLEVLVKNKRQTLTSLQGELEVVLPALAQLQASSAETGRRLADRTDTSAARHAYKEAMKASCMNSSHRANTRRQARENEAASVNTALAALKRAGAGLSPAVTTPAPQVALVDESDSEVNFVQLGMSSSQVEDALLNVFGQQVVLTPGSEPLPRPRRRDAFDSSSTSAKSVQPKIRQLLTQLHKKGKDDVDQHEWCQQEHAQNQLVLRLAKASLGEMSAEVDAHTQAAEDLSQDMSQVEAGVKALQANAKEIQEAATKEQQLLKSHARDQLLATKILAQAIKILSEFKKDGPRGVSAVVSSLQGAKSTFEAQRHSSTGAAHELVSDKQLLSQKATVVMRSLESERQNLELARDNHVSQKERSSNGIHLYQAQVQEANAYLTNLDKECTHNTFILNDRERRLEAHALEDAQNALEGKPLVGMPSAGLRGKAASKAKHLTPMEQAAAEMGVAVDGA